MYPFTVNYNKNQYYVTLATFLYCAILWNTLKLPRVGILNYLFFAHDSTPLFSLWNVAWASWTETFLHYNCEILA